MLKDLANFLRTGRLIVGPWAALAFGMGIVAVGVIPWLILWSTKTAAVAGSFFSAGAAVVAVVLTNHFNQKNENNRKAQARIENLNASALELQLFFLNSTGAATDLAKLCEKRFEDKKTISTKLMKIRIAMALQPFPPRFEGALGSLPHTLGVAVVKYADKVARLAAINSVLQLVDDEDKVSGTSLETIGSVARQIAQRAETCLSISREIGNSKIDLEPALPSIANTTSE